MRKARSGGSRSLKNRTFVGKPRGVIQSRVEAVGPERFGIVAVDCAKARSKWMLCNFYGKVIVAPTIVEHTADGIRAAIAALRLAVEEANLKDSIVAIEMTGIYHRLLQRAFRKAGWDTRIVHPLASKHFRGLLHPNLKTDDHDLDAIFQAAVAGFGICEVDDSEIYKKLQLLCRHRRNLVEQKSRLQVQIRNYIDRTLPGFAALFPDDKFWESRVAVQLARRVSHPDGLRALGVSGIAAIFKNESLKCYAGTLRKIEAWLQTAAEPDPLHETLNRLWIDLDDHRTQMVKKVAKIEGEMASLLVQTPYILLLSVHGLNVVTASDLAAEMGAIEHYSNARSISGRAGLFPMRYQSDETDRCDGPIAKSANMRLRAAWLRVADCLVTCNHQYQLKCQRWRTEGVDPRDIRVRCANRATRMVFQMVAGRKLYEPSDYRRQYLLDKLLTFHREHQTDFPQIMLDMNSAIAMLPKDKWAQEAEPLLELVRRRAGQSQPIADLLMAVLERLGITRQEIEQVQSKMSEARGPR